MALPINPPPSGSAAQQTSGNLTASSTYYYAVTYVGNYGETGLGTPFSVALDSSHNGVSLTSLPTGPAGTTARNIYRTKAGGSVFYYAGTILDNATTTYTDTVADTGLGGAPSQFFLAQGQIQGAFLMFDDESLAATASANYGLVNVGPGPWDGTTTGFFAGSASGTGLAMNFPAGHALSFIDCQAAGVSVFSVNEDGLVKATSSVASHFGGIATAVKAGTPADSDFTSAPPNGTIIVDSSGNKIWARVGGAWKGVAIA
ncbi:MAG TPA: hypothetical protein VKX16_10360 [Chloroflexota bacterium]|nr:hypothetical protein [Chloroflexota bacterium]